MLQKQMHHKPTVDKIIIFGVPNPQRLKLSQIIANQIDVKPLEFYTMNKKIENQEISYKMWAFPQGLKIYNEHHEILNNPHPRKMFTHSTDTMTETYRQSQLNYEFNTQSYPQDNIYSFVLTDYSLNRTYCTCLSWNQKIYVKNDLNEQMVNSMSENYENKSIFQEYTKNSEVYSKALPKCKVSSLLNNPLILDPSVTLVYIPKSIIICSFEIGCFQLQRKLLTHFYKNVILPKRQTSSHQSSVFKIDQKMVKEFEKLCMSNGYPKGEKMFDSKHSEENNPKCQNQKPAILEVKKSKLKQFYLATLFLLDDNASKISVMSENGVPVTAHLTLKTAYSLPKYYDPFTQNIPLLPLPIDKIITLWKNLLLQRQTIIFANSQYQSIILCEFLLYLIQPMKWQNIYIPFLPEQCRHLIDAISGSLIGISFIYMEQMVNNFNLRDKVIVDLKNRVIIDEGEQKGIELPFIIQEYLTKKLTDLVKKYESQLDVLQGNYRGLSILLNLPSKIGSRNSIINPLTQKMLFIEYTLKIQKCFFNAFVCLYNNYTPFIEKRLEGVIAFQTKNYLQIIKDEGHRNFMEQACKTMVFTRLCQFHLEESEKCSVNQRTIGQLFVYSHDILTQKYIKNRENDTQEVLQWSLHQLQTAQNKYYEYHNYLWSKNYQQLQYLIKTTNQYFIEQNKRCKYLQTNMTFFSGNDIDSNDHDVLSGDKHRRAKKWKKYLERSQENTYDAAARLLDEIKVQKYLVKYLKYLEYSEPLRIVKTTSKKKEQENQKSWLFWLWEVINPPMMSRKKQEEVKRFTMKRKLTETGGIFNLALNLRELFVRIQETSKEQDEDVVQGEESDDTESFQAKKEKKIDFIHFEEYQPDDPRVSKTHSLQLVENKKKRRKSRI